MLIAKSSLVMLELAKAGVARIEDVAGANHPEEARVTQECATAHQRLRNASLPSEASAKLIGRVRAEYS